eukprot:13051157-Alexandrium_andersonii.AAC.1
MRTCRAHARFDGRISTQCPLGSNTSNARSVTTGGRRGNGDRTERATGTLPRRGEGHGAARPGKGGRS